MRSLQRDATFSEVVDLVGNMDEEGTAESESRIMEEHSDAVRILSIHRAKGLDFPIVIVAGLGLNKQSRHADFLADPHGERIFALRAGARETGFQTPGWEGLAEGEKIREEAELIRLLYVALTRARDHLILCTHTRGKGTPAAEQPAPGFDSTRLKPLGAFLASLAGQDNHPVNFVNAGMLAAPAAAQTSGMEGQEKAWGATLAAQVQELRRLVLETPQARGLRAAASGGETERDDETLPNPARDRSIRVGIAFHEAMERTDMGWDPDIDGLAQEAGARQRLDGAGVRALKEMLSQSFAAPLIQRARSARLAGGRVWRELPYVRSPGSQLSGIEEGKIDLLFEEGGGWILVDYKTDRIPSGTPELARFFEDTYGGQVRAYVSALKSLGVTVKSAYLLLARTGAEIEIPC
jgi:ATP-dependent exoDNAse (exonuclease V) beta subunit